MHRSQLRLPFRPHRQRTLLFFQNLQPPVVKPWPATPATYRGASARRCRFFRFSSRGAAAGGALRRVLAGSRARTGERIIDCRVGWGLPVRPVLELALARQTPPAGGMHGAENGEPDGQEAPGHEAPHSPAAASSTPSANPYILNWVTVSRRLEIRRPCLFYPKDSKRWSLTFKVTQEGESDDAWKPILFGIVPRDKAREPFDIVNSYPTYGYFLTDFGNLWAHDRTYTHAMGPSWRMT